LSDRISSRNRKIAAAQKRGQRHKSRGRRPGATLPSSIFSPLSSASQLPLKNNSERLRPSPAGASVGGLAAPQLAMMAHGAEPQPADRTRRQRGVLRRDSHHALTRQSSRNHLDFRCRSSVRETVPTKRRRPHHSGLQTASAEACVRHCGCRRKRPRSCDERSDARARRGGKSRHEAWHRSDFRWPYGVFLLGSLPWILSPCAQGAVRRTHLTQRMQKHAPDTA
jgi:hypothetical protein